MQGQDRDQVQAFCLVADTQAGSSEVTLAGEGVPQSALSDVGTRATKVTAVLPRRDPRGRRLAGEWPIARFLQESVPLPDPGREPVVEVDGFRAVAGLDEQASLGSGRDRAVPEQVTSSPLDLLTHEAGDCREEPR